MAASGAAIIYSLRNNEASAKQNILALTQYLKTMEPMEPNIDELAIRSALRMVDSLDLAYAPNSVPRDIVLTGASAMCALALTRHTDAASGTAKEFYRSK